MMTREIRTEEEWRDRANAAENELAELREALKHYHDYLMGQKYGPVIYRKDVAGTIAGFLNSP